MKYLAMFFVVLLLSCVGVQKMDYTKIETHKQFIEKNEWPMMQYPVSFQPVVVQMEKNGWVLIGCMVDNFGSFCAIWENEHGVQQAIIFVRGRMPTKVSIEAARKMYQEICVEKNLCNENPYSEEV